MPKFAPERFDSRQQVAVNRTDGVKTDVVARPVDTYVRPVESDLLRLTQTLAQVAPDLGGYFEAKKKEQNEEEIALGFKASKTKEAIPPEASPYWKQGYIRGHWESASLDSSNKAIEEYSQLRDQPDFKVSEFLQKKMQEDLQGVTNPEAIGIYMKKFGDLEVKLQGDYTQHTIGQLNAARDMEFNKQASDLVARLTDNNHPLHISSDQFGQEVQALQESFKVRGKTRIETRDALLNAIDAHSIAKGGTPDAYDVFFQKDASGNSMASDPAFAEKVAKAKYTAEKQYEQKVDKDLYTTNAPLRASLIDAATKGDLAAVSDEELEKHMGVHGALGAGHESTYHKIRALRDQRMIDSQSAGIAFADAKSGNLWKYDEKSQKGALDLLVGPDLDNVAKNLNEKGFVTAEGFNNIVQIASESGASVIYPKLKQLTESMALAAPPLNSKDAQPPARFTNVAEIFRAMKGAPNGNMTQKYFDEDSRTLMENFTHLRESGMDEGTAYREAYRMIAPENKKSAAEFTNSMQGRELIKESVTNVITGAGADDGSWRPNALRTEGFHVFGTELMKGSIPRDQSRIQSDAYLETERYIRSGGSREPSIISAHLKEWARNNYVHDQTTNTAVKVPAGMVGKDVVAAVSAYTKKQGEVVGGEVVLDYQANGNYAVWRMDGNNRANRVFPDVTFNQILQDHKNTTGLSEEERATIATLQDKVTSGSFTGDDVTANKDLITKARALGAWSGKFKEASDGLQRSPQKDYGMLLKEVQAKGVKPLGPISGDISRIPDLAAKKPVAQQFMKEGDIGGALTVMGEGVALKAYQDPAGKTTIGIGYNIDARAKTVAEDFRRAGITASVEDVKSGKAAINTEQAIRLYRVVLPEYQGIARSAFEKRHGSGSFDKLTSPEKAVLTDMAYQSGTSVEQFTKLFDQMMTKQEIAPDLLNMSYKDMKTGMKKLDDHRKNLRLNVLFGRFDLGMKHAGLS
jgi:GH24 family phage-related lysozyme (muramidase)